MGAVLLLLFFIFVGKVFGTYIAVLRDHSWRSAINYKQFWEWNWLTVCKASTLPMCYVSSPFLSYKFVTITTTINMGMGRKPKELENIYASSRPRVRILVSFVPERYLMWLALLALSTTGAALLGQNWITQHTWLAI